MLPSSTPTSAVTTSNSSDLTTPLSVMNASILLSSLAPCTTEYLWNASLPLVMSLTNVRYQALSYLEDVNSSTISSVSKPCLESIVAVT